MKIVAALLLSPLALSVVHAEEQHYVQRVITPSIPEPQVCRPHTGQHLLVFKHTDTVGHGKYVGFSTLQAFLTPYASFSEFLPFLDIRGHIINPGATFAANLGMGIKWLTNSSNTIGFAFFYDYLQTKTHHFNQICAAFELMTHRIEFRANGYLPVGAKAFSSTTSEVASYNFDHFEGNSLFYTTTYDVRKSTEYAMKGIDTEIGFQLYEPTNYHRLLLAMGPYYYHSPGSVHTHAWGGMVRLEQRVNPYLTIQLRDTWDTQAFNRFQIQVLVEIPFGGRTNKKNAVFRAPCKEVLAMESRMIAGMRRVELIRAETKNQHFYQTVDPIAKSIYGGPLNFIFVNAASPAGGNGTFEAPYNNFGQAKLASYPNNVFYLTGDLIVNDEVPIVQNQSVLGSSIPQTVPFQVTPTTIGYVTIPAMSTMPPTLTQILDLGTLFVNGDNVVISGIDFNLTIPFAAGILNNTSFGDWYPIQNITIINNTFNANSVGPIGVELTAVSGTNLIQNNTFNGNDGNGYYGIYFNQEGPFGTAGTYNADVNILNNAFSGWVDTGILVQANTSTDGASVVNALIMNNTVNDTGSGNGIWAIAGGTSTGHSTINATILNNTSNGGGNNGLQIEAHSEGTINLTACNNNFSNNYANGIYIDIDGSANADLTICNNSIIANSNGIYIPTPGTTQDVGITALFTGNVVRSSTHEGLLFELQNGTATNRLTFENNLFIDNSNGFDGFSFSIYNGSSSTTTIFMNGNVNNTFGYQLANQNTNALSFNIEQGGSNEGIITLPDTGPYNIVERHTAAP